MISKSKRKVHIEGQNDQEISIFSQSSYNTKVSRLGHLKFNFLVLLFDTDFKFLVFSARTLNLFIYLFIFVCVGPSFLCEGFL